MCDAGYEKDEQSTHLVYFTASMADTVHDLPLAVFIHAIHELSVVACYGKIVLVTFRRLSPRFGVVRIFDQIMAKVMRFCVRWRPGI